MNWELVIKSAVITFTVLVFAMVIIKIVTDLDLIHNLIVGLVAGKMTKKAKKIIPNITKSRIINIIRMVELDNQSMDYIQAQDDLTVLKNHDVI